MSTKLMADPTTLYLSESWRRQLRLMVAEAEDPNTSMTSLILAALEQTYGTPD